MKNLKKICLYKKVFMIIFCLVLVSLLLFSLSNDVLGATPKIVNKLSSAFEDIEKWLLKLSTPAAAVAVGVGVFMKKFSFGDEERIRTAKKVIKGSLFSYGFILALDLILSAIKSLI